MGIAQAVCIASPSGHQGRVGFLSLARRNESPAFGERDLQGLEPLMPHLVAALDLCCVTQIANPPATGIAAAAVPLPWTEVARGHPLALGVSQAGCFRQRCAGRPDAMRCRPLKAISWGQLRSEPALSMIPISTYRLPSLEEEKSTS
jgi:hypothetical protein